jgi:predicted ATPase
MDLLGLGGYELRGVDVKNVILGKNGCGKSRCLKAVEQALRGRPDAGVIRYLSPERGGLLRYEPHVEKNLTDNMAWLGDSRRKNQVENFRQQSAAQFRRLELLFLRTLEATPALRSDPTINFDVVLTTLNELLDRVRLERGDPSFRLMDRATNQPVEPDALSSGESELISLGIECLVFQRECVEGKMNVLLIDEPDVHLHPDLQARFARFIEALVEGGAFRLIIATHSTALLGAMSAVTSRLAFMRFGQTAISFAPVGEAHRKVLPVFGAHPLSNVFNQAPVLLVEGEDDERIWQQAVRSANGRIKVYPCGVEGIDALPAFEPEVVNILESVYDSAVG